METMKAVIYEDVGKFSVKQVPVPKVEKGTDLLLRVDACSICGTDVHILSTPPGVDAKKGIVLGHEMVGTIIDKGSDVKGYNIGDRVVIDNNVPCGHCEECQTGHYNTCLNMNGKGVDDDGVLIAPKFKSPIEAKSYMSQLEFFTGSRMHATIGSLSAGVVTVPIAYSRKFSGVFGSLDYPFTLDAYALDTDGLVSQLFDYYDQQFETMRVAMVHARKKALDRNEEYIRYLQEMLTDA